MSNTLSLLCVHGVGHQERDTSWQQGWRDAIAGAVARWSEDCSIECHFVQYDELFDEAELDAATIAEAMLRLSASGAIHGVADAFKRRGFGEVREQVRWTAGMIAQWAADENLRKQTRQRVLQGVKDHEPDVICAHSLGSLITYDLLARDDSAAKGRVFVSLGSQIGNPFVRSTLGGRIVPTSARHWYHLFNREDDVFTARIRSSAPNFEQVDAFFDISGLADHDATEYLRHENTSSTVWRSVALPREPSAAVARTVKAWSEARIKPKQRALLVGINDYPDPADRLEGCVNDTFQMSSVLQELAFQPEDIRVTLNERATAKELRDRLEWLLEGIRPGDVRLFYYSGHGAQIPGYGERGEADHINECLVTHDFDWTLDRTLIDDDFMELYSQLPYDSHFVAILDCCHSGGMTRNGLPKARGLNPPDDIRHRSLKWDPVREMWIPRTLRLAEAEMLKSPSDRQRYLGESGASKRLGRAVSLWSEERDFSRAKKEYKHHGPYTPILLQACRENQFAYEYRHGVISYGAFTYSLATVFRRIKRQKRYPTFKELLGKVSAQLTELKYDQVPVLVGPSAKLASPIDYLLKRRD